MATDTRENLLEAATQVFAEKGFSGARVDEIAARAGANKAMIYYHFGPKEDLYQATLLRVFGGVIEAVDAVESEIEDPLERLSSFYRRLAELFQRQPALPSIMMREALAGGRHMTPQTAQLLTRVVSFVSAAVDAGSSAGRMRRVHPLTLHLSSLGPLLLFFVTEALRDRVMAAAAPGLKPPATASFLDYADQLLRRGLAPDRETV